MTETQYRVTGMTCEHCVRSVTEEIEAIPGVSAVAVELSSGAVTVTGGEHVTESAVRAAIEGAGYALAESTSRNGAHE